MNSTSLQDFVSHARAVGRINYGDLRRLQRDILPARLTSREDAELLISLDAAVQKTDPDWSAYLVGAVRDFVVWGTPPIGLVDSEKAEWLARAFAAAGGAKTARMITREVIDAACEENVVAALMSGRRMVMSYARDSTAEPRESEASAPSGPDLVQ